jgi:hypothetical protein
VICKKYIRNTLKFQSSIIEKKTIMLKCQPRNIKYTTEIESYRMIVRRQNVFGRRLNLYENPFKSSRKHLAHRILFILCTISYDNNTLLYLMPFYSIRLVFTVIIYFMDVFRRLQEDCTMTLQETSQCVLVTSKLRTAAAMQFLHVIYI